MNKNISNVIIFIWSYQILFLNIYNYGKYTIWTKLLVYKYRYERFYFILENNVLISLIIWNFCFILLKYY